MDTKQDKIIAFISAALAAIILIVVIACNVVNDSSDVNLESESNESVVDVKDVIEDANASLSGAIGMTVGVNLETEEETTEEESVEASVETEEIVVEAIPYKYAGMFLANVSESLNVRAEANKDSELLGKLYPGDGGEVLERGASWSKIKSGNLVGYVKNEFIYFEEDIEAHETEFERSVATSTVNTLRIRRTADENGVVVGTVDIGIEMKVLQYGETWTNIEVSGITGYVATAYLTITYEMGTGLTLEEEQAAIEAELERQRLEAEAAEAERRRREEALAQAIANSNFVETIQTSPYNISEEDAYLIACVVSAEAGGDIYEDQLAVANVILNRLSAGYGATVSDVVYARGQFAVVPNGSLDRYMNNGPLPVAVQATKDAIAGTNNVPNYKHFCALSAAQFWRYNSYTIIGLQVFYN